MPGLTWVGDAVARLLVTVMARRTAASTGAVAAINGDDAVVDDVATLPIAGLRFGIGDAAGAALRVTDGIGLRAAAVITAGLARLAGQISGTDFAGTAGRIAVARTAVDALLAVVLDESALAGACLRLGVWLALVLLVFSLVTPLAVLMGFLAPLAPPLGLTLVIAKSCGKPTTEGECGEPPQHAAAAASGQQRLGQSIE
jgi:hypothetical protein